MRKDTSFSEKKLTTEEFSNKYWMGGKMEYQYHTASIEDGRDDASGNHYPSGFNFTIKSTIADKFLPNLFSK